VLFGRILFLGLRVSCSVQEVAQPLLLVCLTAYGRC
jgi:hypothetical protein